MIIIIYFLYAHEATAARPIRGFYEVPTSSELSDVARIPVKFKSQSYAELETKIEFPLPLELTGVQQLILIEKESPNTNTWIGSQVNGECQKKDRYFVCNMKFKNLTCSTEKAALFIQENYPSAQFNSRVMLSQQFCGEPIGILTYKLRGGIDEK